MKDSLDQLRSDAILGASVRLANGTPFSIYEIIKHLSKATDILMNRGYDGHGHEVLVYANDAAKSFLKSSGFSG